MQLLHSKILGKGRPLLILHGLLGMGDNWITLGRTFTNEGFEVHLIDQRNHGKSFHADEMNYGIMVEDLHHYCQHFQLNNINIIGHSMGGKTAMHYAMAYPKNIDKLIVVDISPVTYPPHHHFIFDTIKQVNLHKAKNRKQISEIVTPLVNNKAISNFILKNLYRNQKNEYHWKANITILENSLVELGDAIPPQSFFYKPTLFIKGERSPYIKKTHQTIIRAHFPNSQIVNIPNSGHWVHAEQTEIFFKKVILFLNI